MADRVSSDNPSIVTVRGTLATTATGHRIEIPTAEEAAFPVDEVVRIELDGVERFARPEQSWSEENLTIPGIYETPDGARDPSEGTDRLPEWIETADVRSGGSVLIDVVEPSFYYGLRAPGEALTYEAPEPPSESLASIARSLESDDPDS